MSSEPNVHTAVVSRVQVDKPFNVLSNFYLLDSAIIALLRAERNASAFNDRSVSYVGSEVTTADICR